MPSYEFECEDCGHAEDQVHSITKAPPLGQRRRCPKCEGPALTRVLRTAPVIADAKLRFSGKYPYESRQHAAGRLSGIHQVSADGHPIIESAAHEREVMAASGLVRD